MSDTVTDDLSAAVEPETVGGLPVRKPHEGIPWQNILLYGDSGVGKTTLAASATKVESMVPMLHIDIEDGTDSLIGLYDPDIVEVRSAMQLQKVYNDLESGKSKPYKTISLDNISEFQNFGLLEIMAMDGKNDPGKRKNVGFIDPDVPEWQHYHRSTEQMRRIIRGFRDLPCHTIFVAHETLDKEERTKRETVRPALTTKAARAVPGYVNEVWYYYMKGGKRILLTQKHGNTVAKSRARLPQTIEEPTMANIMALLSERTEK